MRRTLALAGLCLLAGCADGQITPQGQQAIAAGATLAGVAAAANKTVADVVAKGQLFCASSAGVVALVNGLAEPNSVIGQAADVVALSCKAIGAVPAPPPADPGTAPAVVAPIVVLPTS